MLKQMREGAKSTALKLVLFGLLLLAMTGLALMDVQGMFRRGFSNGTIVSFGHDKMTAVEFDHLVQAKVRQKRMKQSEAYRVGIPRHLLNQEIDDHIFSMAANDLGLEVDDTLAAAKLKEALAPIVAQGMTEKEALQTVLQNNNASEGQLVASIKQQIAVQGLLATITANAHVPQQLIDDALKYRHEQRRGEYFTLTAADLGAAKQPTEDELKAYYATISHDYDVPETRTLSVLVLDKKILGDSLKPSAEKLKQYYDDNISDFKTPETRVISQVVAQDEASAKQIFAEAQKTKDMQKAAEAAGKGKGNYIKPGTFTEASLPAEIAKSAFAGAAGSVLAPLKSPLGWHVLYIEKVTPGTTKSFESAKADIEKELSQDKVSEALYQRANKIDDELAGGKSLADVAKENGLTENVLDRVDAHGLGPTGKKIPVSFPLYDKVIETGFGLKQGASSPLIETPDGAFLVVGVKNINPSEQLSFDKVRSDILSRWQHENETKGLAEKSAKVMERLKLGDSFEKVAQEYKKTVETTGFVQRDTSPAKVNADLLNALFTLDQLGQATSVSQNGQIILVRLAERKVEPTKNASKEDVSTIEGILSRSFKQDLLEEYRLSLMDKYNVSVNEKLMSEMYTPKDDKESSDE